jgi:hypothetical protein
MINFVQDGLPSLIVPVAVLVVGWIAALLMSAITRRALRRTGFDDSIARKFLGTEKAGDFDSARWSGKVVYYLVLLLTAVAFLQVTKLTAASEPIGSMLHSVMAFLPQILGAVAIGFGAWLLATITRSILRQAFSRWGMDRRLQEQGVSGKEESAEASEKEPVGSAIADASYWLILLLFVPAVLSTLRMDGLLVPVQEMLNSSLGFVPNIVSAIVIAGVGWLVARIVQKLLANTLDAAGANRLSDRVGLTKVLGEQTLSQLLGFVAYLLILIPVAIGALNALQLDAITGPASAMLESFFAAMPAIFGAALVVSVAYVVGRVVSVAVSKLLNGIGFDKVLTKIGVSEDQEIAERSPSDLVGGLVLVSVLYFGALEAAKLLGFTALVALGSSFAVLAGHVLLGLAIFGLALYLGRIAAEAIHSSDMVQKRVLGIAARVAVVVLGSAMALRQMGIADEIIELAFGLTLGGAAIAVALAFGLGGREVASKALEEMRDRLKSEAEANRAGGGIPMAASATASPEFEADK